MNLRVNIARLRYMVFQRASVWTILFVSVAATTLAQNSGKIACIPQRPIVHAGEEIRISAFALAPTENRVQYAWSATAGHVIGTGNEASWNFQDVLSGVYTST